jgi:hypothetical protein
MRRAMRDDILSIETVRRYIESRQVDETHMDDLLKRAIAYVRSGTGLDDQIRIINGLKLPYGSEDDKKRCLQVEQIVRMLQDYVETGDAKRPLSIVVFGPPGSGKSTFVDRITNAVKCCRPIPTANLTQLTGPDDLVKTFRLALPQQTEHAPGPESPSSPEPGRELTPVFFFDEFDASLNDAPLGWLRWFLGPMQDGKLLANGQELKIGKAGARLREPPARGHRDRRNQWPRERTCRASRSRAPASPGEAKRQAHGR